MGWARMNGAGSTGAEQSSLPDRAASQAECDAIAAAARSGSAGVAQAISTVKPLAPLLASDDIIDCRLAEEIDYARRLLEAVGDRLIADPIILNRHQTTLQSFDIIGQLLGHLAKVAGSRNKAQAIDQIGMQELRGRLQRPAAGMTRSGTMGRFQRSSS